MAKGRIIVNAITMDKRINDLSDDTSRLAFTWLVTFADREGRTHGDPALVRSMLFPRRSDVTVEQMEGYIREWAAAGLVVWYEAEDDRWIKIKKRAWLGSISRDGSKWGRIRLEILKRDNYVCQYCGAPASHVDHIIPVSRNGDSNPENLVAACATCNLEKRARTPSEWKSEKA